MRSPRGVVLWRGQNESDGAPLVAIATFKSRNAKNGALVQTWILRSDLPPTDDSGRASICGGCPMKRGGCYVIASRAPLAVWKSYQRGIYPPAREGYPELAGRLVRIGSFGDPAFVPRYVWNAVREVAAGVVGYTHQIRQLPRSAWGMVSCESEQQARAAWAAGRRTFRMLAPGQIPTNRECVCPSERGVTCDRCMLCDPEKRAKSIVIPAHGFQVKKAIDKIHLAVMQ